MEPHDQERAPRLSDLLDVGVLGRLAEANYRANGMPIGIVDAVDGAIVVGVGWQEICVAYHRVNAETAERCRESDELIKQNLTRGAPFEYRCRNGLRDIGIPIVVAGIHLATLFLGQFFYEEETPDRAWFAEQARRFGFDEAAYLAALHRVPVFSRKTVENILAYNGALARFIADVADAALRQQAANARLREADRRKDEFLGMLSHELRNPLAPIRNAVYLLRHGDPAGDQGERARTMIERQTEHLTRLVDDLLDVTRIARGKIQLRRERVDVREILLRAADDFRIAMEDRRLSFRAELPSAPVWADADPTRLTQAVGNLLHNAAKFTRGGDEVVLSLRAADGQAEIRVRDTGVGIDPALLPRVFDLFVQGERTLARTEGGLGIGLALVKGVVELHGGTARAESAGHDAGAEITIRLPLVAPAAPEDAARPAGAAAARPRRVLVVDDNADAAESLADIARLLGHEVEVAFDGPSAITCARASRPDVVLCDIGLPGVDGYEVARAIRASGAQGVQLVAVTGYAQPEDVQRAADAGFDRHVAKPPDLAVIEEVLSQPG